MAALDFPDAPTLGQMYGSAGTLWRWDGARWASTAGVEGPRGIIAFKMIEDAITGITAEVTAISVQATLVAGRRYRVRARTRLNSTVANDRIISRIRDGAGTSLSVSDNLMLNVTHVPSETFDNEAIIVAATTGPQTFNLTVNRNQGTGTITVNAANTSPTFIYVEDVSYEAGSAPGAVTPTAWTTVTLTAPWTHNAGEPVQYRMNRDVAEWRGRCNASPGANTAYFTAPAGFRPPFNQPIAIAVVDGGVWTTNACYFKADGVIATLGGAHTAASFAGVTYSVTP